MPDTNAQRLFLRLPEPTWPPIDLIIASFLVLIAGRIVAAAGLARPADTLTILGATLLPLSLGWLQVAVVCALRAKRPTRKDDRD